jgi:murein DD-endopeptidase MepM/ murein hydrolase activator NlpD
MSEEAHLSAVRYLVEDVDASLPALGFRLVERWGPPFAIVKRKGLSLWLSGPGTSARRKLPDGRTPGPGGWNRVVIEVDDLDETAAKLRAAGAGRRPGTRGIRMMRNGVLLSLLLIGLPGLAASQDDQALAQGRELTRLFYEEKADSLWERFSTPMRDVFGGLPGLKAFRQKAGSQLGAEASVISETTESVGDNWVYTRTASFQKDPDPILVRWSFDSKGSVTGFLVTPAKEAPSEYLEYETRTRLRLPFQGEWHVFWGGRSLSENYHAKAKDQRFAYDLLILKDGASHAGEGKRNEDYYCFGRPVVAPGSGIVHAVEDSIEDNVPGVMNPRQAMGNHVVVDHGNGEFSFLAHFRRGSVRVKAGDRVNAGDVLGLCGNSGNSSEPHLHYHLQDTPEPFMGSGLPAQFVDYIADGQAVERGEPTRGQRIRPKDD